jgi:purine catabolism regulator
VALQSLGTGRRPRGYLAVGTEGRLDTQARYIVHAAVALLTLSLEQSRVQQDTEQRLGAALLRMLLAGEPGHARTVAGRLYGDLLDAPVRVLVAEGDAETVTLLAERVEAVAARAAEPVLAVRDGDRLTVLAAGAGAVLPACARFAEEDVPEAALVAGLSAVTAGTGGVPAAYAQAERALAVARRRGRSLVEHDDVGSGSVLPLLGDEAVRAFAEGLLQPLRDHDAHARGDLVASLHAWLSRHGQWDAAAADLGVHRHTLRYRMRRVEEILGRSLDDPDVRMELWLALKASASG